MKTYKELITELNKVELAMKAGKLGVKSLRRLRLKPSSIMSPNRKVPVYDILKLRNSPRSPIVSKRKQIENIMKASKNPDDIYYSNKGQLGLARFKKGSLNFAGTELDTAVRHKSLRGRSKAVVRQDQKMKDAKTALKKATRTGSGKEISKSYYPSYPRTKAPTVNKTGPYGPIHKITTRTPKKGSIPEPPKK